MVEVKWVINKGTAENQRLPTGLNVSLKAVYDLKNTMVRGGVQEVRYLNRVIKKGSGGGVGVGIWGWRGRRQQCSSSRRSLPPRYFVAECLV